MNAGILSQGAPEGGPAQIRDLHLTGRMCVGTHLHAGGLALKPSSLVLLAGLVVVLSVAAPAVGASHKVIIDQDAFGPGGSNMQAILLALQDPDVEVLGITIESGDGWCAENAAHTLRLLELIGRVDVPVVPGSTYPLVNSAEATKRWEARYGKLVYKGAWTEQWPSATVARRPPHAPDVVPPLLEGEPRIRAAAETAAGFLVRKVREFPGEVTVLALGPYTNIALAVRLDDSFAGLAKELVLMGGSFSPKPAENEFAREYLYTPRLEFNFRWDPEATQIALHAPWKRVLQVPVDATTRTLFTRELAARATAADTPVARYVAQYAQPYPMWDEVAVASWLEPELITKSEAMAVDVDTDHGAGYGNTLSWPAAGGPGLGERGVEVVLGIDVPRFEQWCVDAFTRLPDPAARARPSSR
jgi:purine nucleosidase